MKTSMEYKNIHISQKNTKKVIDIVQNVWYFKYED